MNYFKKSLAVWGCISVLIISLVSCKKEPIPTGTLFGRIFYQGTTVPVPDVIVDVNGLTDTSSQTGYYMIYNVPVGEYVVHAKRSGFDPGQAQLVMTTLALEQNFYLTSGLFTSSVLGNIRGNQTGNPQSDVNIIMLNPDGKESLLQTISDLEGKYELTNIPQGERTILFKSGSSEISRCNINLQNWDYVLDISVPEEGIPFTFIDERDGNNYLSMGIGKQTWMLENLRYLPVVHSPGQESTRDSRYYVYLYSGNDVKEAKESICYNRFGVAYNYPAALKTCPDGWHLPSDKEWNELQIHLGMSRYESAVQGFQSSGNVGYKLKSETGWPDGENGDNSSHMNLSPYGGKMDHGSFYLPTLATLWASTEFDTEHSWTRIIEADNKAVYRSYSDKLYGHYIRCVKD
jgi:uncharacterized protein (TIGR02145 family)